MFLMELRTLLLLLLLLLLYERKILRRILGPINYNGTWRIRYNKEIYTLYGDPELSTVIKLRRLQWAGHVQRMEGQSVSRMVMANAQ
jgi:hypothetical protein